MIEVFDHLPTVGDSKFVRCLDIDGRDPPDAVVVALKKNRMSVPVSECTYDSETIVWLRALGRGSRMQNA